ncbi:MAG: hypothetical protein U0667_14250 [Chloroflexota bacterium]
MTTAVIATALSIRPATTERNELNETLTTLRKRGLLHFEYDRNDGRPARWWGIP